jgi:hypothetical protein
MGQTEHRPRAGEPLAVEPVGGSWFARVSSGKDPGSPNRRSTMSEREREDQQGGQQGGQQGQEGEQGGFEREREGEPGREGGQQGGQSGDEGGQGDRGA